MTADDAERGSRRSTHRAKRRQNPARGPDAPPVAGVLRSAEVGGTWSRQRSFQISENRWSSNSQSPSSSASDSDRRDAHDDGRPAHEEARAPRAPRAGRRGSPRSAASRWPCTVASTLVVIPQSGHGTPVSVRSGHGRPAWPGRNGSTRRGAEHRQRRAASVRRSSIVVEEAGSRTRRDAYCLGCA